MSTHRSALPTRRRTRAGAVTGLLAGLAGLSLALAGSAAAHVTVNPKEAAQGGWEKLTFRVPNESPTAGTVKLEVSLPLDTPIAAISTKPVPGWTATVTTEQLDEPLDLHGRTVTEAASTITWVADAGVRIGPGEFQEFEISAGPLPEVEELVLPAVQTYDDGTVVAWDEVAEGEEELAKPAPVLRLAAGGEDHHGGSTDDATDDATDGEGTDGETGTASDGGVTASGGTGAGAASSGSDSAARLLGGAGLVVGALGLGTAAMVGARTRRGAGQ